MNSWQNRINPIRADGLYSAIYSECVSLLTFGVTSLTRFNSTEMKNITTSIKARTHWQWHGNLYNYCTVFSLPCLRQKDCESIFTFAAMPEMRVNVFVCLWKCVIKSFRCEGWPWINVTLNGGDCCKSMTRMNNRERFLERAFPHHVTSLLYCQRRFKSSRM